MEMAVALGHAVTAAGLAASLAVVFTAPAACIVPSFVSGLATYLVRESLAGIGMHEAGATAIASATAVLVAMTVTPKRLAATVVVIAAIIPLSAGVALFAAITDLLKVSTYQGAALEEASIGLNANLARAFTTFAAIAFGLQLGFTLARLLRIRTEP